MEGWESKKQMNQWFQNELELLKSYKCGNIIEKTKDSELQIFIQEIAKK